MKSKTILPFIELGGIINYLKFCGKNSPVHGDGFVLNNIIRFLKYIEELEFKVTKNMIGHLYDLIEDLKEKPEDHKLSYNEYNKLKTLIDKFRFLITAEAVSYKTFFITEKRINVEYLISDISSLFAPDVFDSLPHIIRKDLEEAGKCIAFECSTAGAFLILRGMEALQRKLLISLNPQANTQDKDWGTITNELRALNIPDISSMVNILDRIRTDYRNPTAHPEKRYNIEEVQDLFNLSEGVINQIVNYMRDNGFL